MTTKIELLAPGGDVDSIKAAIIAGADAIYCGLNRFNARNRAQNIDLDDLSGILRLAHKNNCKIFITLNIIIVETEINALLDLLTKLVNTSIDGIIIQDFGVYYLILKYFKDLNIHASTQLTTHNKGQVAFLSKLSTKRINLSRELNISEISELTHFAHDCEMQTEVFVHGSYCISFSGICYMSSFQSGNSGNRGRCSQPCRERYQTTEVGKNYPLNLKDNSAFFNLSELSKANVDSLKIEGRMKGFDYVYTVVNVWHKQIQRLINGEELSNDNSELYKVFNRDFSNSFLTGEINKDMYIDNPRVNSIMHLTQQNNYSSVKDLETAKMTFFDEKERFKQVLANDIAQISISKSPIEIVVSGVESENLTVEIKTQDFEFVVSSESCLAKNGKQVITKELIFNKLKTINDTEYYIKDVNTDNLNSNLSIAFKELTLMKNKILYALNSSKKEFDVKSIPAIEKLNIPIQKPYLSVLINNPKDVYLTLETDAKIFFQLPNVFSNNYQDILQLFENNRNLIPWFPSILIGDSYRIACEFLHKLSPQKIITNNTGIAYEAYKSNIEWIAGPYLNITNSYSLLLLKEEFNCSGAFISSEINKWQIKSIKTPNNFELYYSIYHPIMLMTSRQCLFQQVTGCVKNKVDNDCMLNCSNIATITNSKHEDLIVEKSKGNYNRIFNEINCLNLDVVKDIKSTFSSYFIDLRDIKTKTNIVDNKLDIVKVFEDFIVNDSYAKNKIEQIITPTINKQYKKGI